MTPLQEKRNKAWQERFAETIRLTSIQHAFTEIEQVWELRRYDRQQRRLVLQEQYEREHPPVGGKVPNRIKRLEKELSTVRGMAAYAMVERREQKLQQRETRAKEIET